MNIYRIQQHDNESSNKKKPRAGSFDETLVNLASPPASQKQSHTTAYHSSSHHSSKPLTSRYGSLPQDILSQESLFSKFNSQNEAIREKSSDLEQQSLLNQETMTNNVDNRRSSKKISDRSNFVYYFVYALLNTTMSVPSLYGYASVIFNHEVFQPHIATLSKLVIWSSAVHQLCFVVFSSLSFAKAEVQDAGLLFLSIMTNYIADTILADGGNMEEILSTSIVTLATATASLGLVLMFLGKFNCANAVSYLPLPVVGGYLAFIGYFCVVAGVGLCISKSMIGGNFLTDLQLLADKQSFVLALPGLLAGLLMMIVARLSRNDAVLPLTMFLIPTSFYVFLYLVGMTLDDARKGKWIGKVQESASVSSLIELVDFHQVRW
jgi:SulP family sulfate permease